MRGCDTRRGPLRYQTWPLRHRRSSKKLFAGYNLASFSLPRSCVVCFPTHSVVNFPSLQSAHHFAHTEHRERRRRTRGRTFFMRAAALYSHLARPHPQSGPAKPLHWNMGTALRALLVCYHCWCIGCAGASPTQPTGSRQHMQHATCNTPVLARTLGDGAVRCVWVSYTALHMCVCV